MKRKERMHYKLIKQLAHNKYCDIIFRGIKLLWQQMHLKKWDRGKTLLLESLYKPDTKLRGCAYNQGCYDEMIELRDSIIEYVKSLPNPHHHHQI